MMHHRSAISVPALFLTLALGSPATSQAPTEFKITASDAQSINFFGNSVALSGDTALGVRPGLPPGRLTSPGDSPTLDWPAGG